MVYNKMCLWMVVVFSTYPVMLYSSVVAYHGLHYSATLRRIQHMHKSNQIGRLPPLMKKLNRIIEQKERVNALKECNTTGEDVIAEIKKRYDEITAALATKRPGTTRAVRIHVKDFIKVYRKKEGVSRTSTNHRSGKMVFKNGCSLTQNKSGKIFGSIPGNSDKNTIFSMKSHGPNVLMLQNVHTKQFIAMDKHGHLYSRASSSHETLFYLRIEENEFYTLASYRYYLVCPFDMFVAIRNNGVIKSPYQSVPGQDSTQFLLIPHK